MLPTLTSLQNINAIFLANDNCNEIFSSNGTKKRPRFPTSLSQCTNIYYAIQMIHRYIAGCYVATIWKYMYKEHKYEFDQQTDFLIIRKFKYRLIRFVSLEQNNEFIFNFEYTYFLVYCTETSIFFIIPCKRLQPILQQIK